MQNKSNGHKAILGGHLTRRSFMSATGAVLATPLLAKVAPAEGGVVALVHTQAAGDSGPIDGMIARLKGLATEKGFEPRIVYAQDPSTYETILRGLAQAGARIIATTFAGMVEPLKTVAPAFPDTRFVHIFADPMQPPVPNVSTVSYDYHHGCYLSGLFGSRFSRSKKLGYVGGANLPGQIADLNAIKLAVTAADPSVSVTGAFAGSFQDPAKGQEIATQLYQSGVDYIQTDGAATDVGSIRASMEHSGVVVSAQSREHPAMSPKTVISIVLIDFGQSLHNAVSAALETGWTGGHHASGLGDGVIDFQLSEPFQTEGDPDMVARAKAIMPEIEKAKAEIIAGTLKVPFEGAM